MNVYGESTEDLLISPKGGCFVSMESFLTSSLFLICKDHCLYWNAVFLHSYLPSFPQFPLLPVCRK